MGHALTGVIPSIRFGIGCVLGQSRERQDRGGGGADDDLKFPFHILLFFHVLFFFRAELSLSRSLEITSMHLSFPFSSS
jgi:hypothetical protein